MVSTKRVAKAFATLDNAILTRIAESACTFTSIKASVEYIAEPFGKGPHDTFRAVDRRLQALRKRGLIYFFNTKWFLQANSNTPRTP